MTHFFHTFLLALAILMFSTLSFSPSAQAIKIFGKKEKAAPVQQQIPEEDEDEKDEDYVDRENADLSQLQSKELLVEGAVCETCVYKIKSVLQESPEVFKVNHVGLKNFYVYFNKGKTLSDNKITDLIATAGFKILAIKAGKPKQAEVASENKTEAK